MKEKRRVFFKEQIAFYKEKLSEYHKLTDIVEQILNRIK